MLTLKNINVSFGSNHILKNLSCTVEKGDFIVILGTNGAGKSTFFDTIAGKVTPQNGTITLENKEITKLSELQRSGMITRIFQSPHLNCVGTLTVAQNLAMALYSRRNARLVDGMQAMPLRQKHQQINVGELREGRNRINNDKYQQQQRLHMPSLVNMSLLLLKRTSCFMTIKLTLRNRVLNNTKY